MNFENATAIEEVLMDSGFRGALEVIGLGGLIAFLIAFAVFALMIMLGLYIYMALAWSTIARKLKYDKYWLAWIPVANFFLLPILAKKHWAWGFFILIPPVYFILAIFWLWNIYEQRNYPGALSLIVIGHFIPSIKGMALIANLVVFGLVAWKDVGGRSRSNGSVVKRGRRSKKKK